MDSSRNQRFQHTANVENELKVWWGIKAYEESDERKCAVCEKDTSTDAMHAMKCCSVEVFNVKAGSRVRRTMVVEI